MDAVMTIPEVAAVLRISRPAVYPLIHKGLLETTDVSGGDGIRTRTRVYAKSVDELLAKRRNK